MSGDLEDLARAAADALVSAMVTDSWETVRRRFAALVGHEQRMDVGRAQLASATGEDRSRVTLDLARSWSIRLRDALEDSPGLAEQLRALLNELDATRPSSSAPTQHAVADHGSQAVNVGGHISGNKGDLFVGVGKVDKRRVNIAVAPLMFLFNTAKKLATAYPAATAVVVVLAGATVTGWQAHWPNAVFGAATPRASGAAGPAPDNSASVGSPAQTGSDSTTQTFPDGTRVTFVSANWTTFAPFAYNPVHHGATFTFHVVAGPSWTGSGNQKVMLRPISGGERPLDYYMVTASGWAYPNYNSTGYADETNYMPGSQSRGSCDQLAADDSVDVLSTLYPLSDPVDPQHVVVTIEMPNGQLASRSFTVSVGSFVPADVPSPTPTQSCGP
jgi:hypothetical protein